MWGGGGVGGDSTDPVRWARAPERSVAGLCAHPREALAGVRPAQRYRSPRGFDETCQEVRAIAAQLVGSRAGVSERSGEQRAICSVWFDLDGRRVGLTVLSPLTPEAAARFRPEENESVYVDVKVRGSRGTGL